jgi:Biotin carboxyl carrier protein
LVKSKKGETILIIEAMKTMNHIQASVDGEIIELSVSDGEAIEYDQILAKIK